MAPLLSPRRPEPHPRLEGERHTQKTNRGHRVHRGGSGQRLPSSRNQGSYCTCTIEHFAEKQIGVEFLQLESVLNAQHKVRRLLNAPLIGADILEENLKESVEWLKSKGHQIEGFEEPEYRGLAFATATNLNVLRKCGHLTIMDPMHKTNNHSWKLYTVLVRDSFGSWLPGGHFLVSGKEQSIVTKGLQVLKRWAQIWKSRYFIVDLSSIEENAIYCTFRGLEAGEQEVGVFYCTWHSRQALYRNLGSYGKGYELMLQAMYKFTRIGCEQLVEQAIRKLPLDQSKSTSVEERQEVGDVEPPVLSSAAPDDLLKSRRVLPRRAEEEGQCKFWYHRCLHDRLLRRRELL